MTTIAVRDGIIAADSSITAGSTRSPPGSVSKLILGKRHKVVYAGAGDFSLIHAAVHALERLRTPPWSSKVARECDLSLGDDTILLVLTKKHGLITFEGEGWYPINSGGFYAIGSGETAALAAMWCGKSAVEAVEIACKVDTGSTLPVLWHAIADI
jgi:hypothetical protein